MENKYIKAFREAVEHILKEDEEDKKIENDYEDYIYDLYKEYKYNKIDSETIESHLINIGISLERINEIIEQWTKKIRNNDDFNKFQKGTRVEIEKWVKYSHGDNEIKNFPGEQGTVLDCKYFYAYAAPFVTIKLDNGKTIEEVTPYDLKII